MEELKMESKKIIMQQFFENVGGSRLLDWLEEVGYYTAPASMKHHASYEGSLFDHSLQVTHELIMLTDKLGLKWQRKESPAVVGMLHDVCKMDDYVIQQEVVSVDQGGGPVYGPGQAVWNEEALWPGHGDKSLIMLMGHIDLTVDEKLCIRYHMGAFTDSKEWKYYTEAVKRCPNVLYTHTADMIATKIKGV